MFFALVLRHELQDLGIDVVLLEIDRRHAFTVIDAPSFVADPERDGTRSEVFIALSFEQRLVLIGGTSYAAAYVSGVAALVRSKFPDLTAAEVIHRITATAHGAARSPSN